MAAHEVVDGLVPGGPVLFEGDAVPPVVVEVAVAEAHDLGHEVEEGLEEREEGGEPDDQADGG